MKLIAVVATLVAVALGGHAAEQVPHYVNGVHNDAYHHHEVCLVPFSLSFARRTAGCLAAAVGAIGAIDAIGAMAPNGAFGCF